MVIEPAVQEISKKKFRVSVSRWSRFTKEKPSQATASTRIWIRRRPASFTASSSPHPGQHTLRRALLPTPFESIVCGSLMLRPRPPWSAPGPRWPARARAADRDGLLNTLLAATDNGWDEEEDTDTWQR
ncbi:hypothetical protein D1007_52127 [Hordeum vulgare]|nr:hypothetical protein D1007_52127 [Hordeum vulgare]